MSLTNAQAALQAAAVLYGPQPNSTLAHIPDRFTNLERTAASLKKWLDAQDTADKQAADIAAKGTVTDRLERLERRVIPSE